MIINSLQNELKECGGFCDELGCSTDALKGRYGPKRMIPFRDHKGPSARVIHRVNAVMVDGRKSHG